LALALVAAVISGCAGSVSLSGPTPTSPASSPASSPQPPAEPTAEPPPERPPTARTAPEPPTPRRDRHPHEAAPRLDTWQVGASPLPLRPDGYGRVLPTPRELRVRRLPTVDRLPPPARGDYEAAVESISPRVRRRMGTTWSPRCPVGLHDLRYVTTSFWGFDGRPHTGELVVNARVAQDVVGVFRRLYRTRYPIEEMRLVTTSDLEARPTGDGNNTAAFVCRPARGQSQWSAHAYGLAVDVNPFLNPYRDGDLVLPELASAYLERGWHRRGMITEHGVVVDAFDAIGWTWGGGFESVSDPMHFSATGR
jgi:D-alanyl-D-alanine carboxypeptidase